MLAAFPSFLVLIEKFSARPAHFAGSNSSILMPFVMPENASPRDASTPDRPCE